MFKKTLLAVSILGTASFAVNAGQLTADVTETAAQVTAFSATTCQAAADALGVDLDLNGNTYDAAGTAAVGTPTDGGTAGAYDQAANVVQLTGASACTVDINSDVLVDASSVANSLEGAQADGLTISATKIAGVGGYSLEDTVRITVTGGTVNELASQNAKLNFGLDGAAQVAQGTEFQLIGVLGNDILFTVTAVNTVSATEPQVPFEIVTISGLNVTPNDGVTEISLSAETQNTANVIYDTSAEAKVSELKAQYSSALVSGYDGVIDVSKERLSLAVNANDAFNPSAAKITPAVSSTPAGAEAIDEDTAVLQVTVETSQGNLVADSADLVIKGDFSWMADLAGTAGDKPDSTELLTGLTYAVFTDAALTTAGNDEPTIVAISDDYQELTITLDPAPAGETTDLDLDAYHAVGFKVPGELAGTTSLSVTDFEAGLVVKDAADNEAEVLAADTKIGEWTLNGSVVTIPYMAFGPNTKPIIRHTSTGNQVGDITVKYLLEDTVTDNANEWISVGTAYTDVSRGVLNITEEVMKLIQDDIGAEKGKVAIEITTNVPAADVTIFAGYNVKNSADDRAVVGTFGELGAAGASTLN
jgi:hypothetical protein